LPQTWVSATSAGQARWEYMQAITPERFAERIRDAVKRPDEATLDRYCFVFPPYWGDNPSLYVGFPGLIFDAIFEMIRD
jgi:hypothetical protein